MILAIFIVSLLAVSAVSAADNASSDIAGTDGTTDEVVSVEENGEILQENVLGVSPGTFTDLANDIANAKSELNLDRNYAYSDGDSDYKGGITIDKKIAINGNGYTIDGDNQARVFNITASDVVLKNINFVNCSSDFDYGGAIYWNASAENGVLTNCSFVNSIGLEGGAVYWASNKGLLNDCTFVKATAVTRGGAVCWVGADGTMSDCSITGSHSSENAGAICWIGSNGNMVDCSLLDCYSAQRGGAVLWFGDNGVLSDCSFVNCDYAYLGGAVCLWYSNNDVLRDCSFVNCSANSNGGAVYCVNATNSTLSDCSFVNCAAALNGGGAYFESKDCSLIYPTFEGCTAQEGPDWYSVYDLTVIQDTKTSTAITAPDVTTTYGTSANLVATLKDSDNNILVGEEILILLNNKEYALNTDFNGQVSIAVPADLAPRTYVATIRFAGNDKYAPSSTAANVVVNKLDSVLTASDVTTFNNSGAKLVATLKDADGNVISGAQVKIELNGVINNLTTDNNGQVSLTTDGLVPGIYTAAITFGGDSNYKESSTSARVIIKDKQDQKQSKIYLRNALYFVLQTKYVTVTLWDGDNNPIEGKTVYINLDEYGLKYSGVTDENGNAVIRIGVGFGVHAATVSFDGDDEYNASERTGSVRVIKETPSVMVRGADAQLKANDNPQVVKVYLRDRYNNPLLEGTKIFIRINGIVFSGLTDSEGIARVELRIEGTGTYDAQAIYAGNTAYNAVIRNIKLYVS